jgi:glucose-1-phosphate thymidylyltransferase
MKAVIPAAGEGTRLRPLTDEKPKPLVEVGGEPILAHCLRTLRQIEVTEAIVVVGDRGDLIRERFGDEFEGIDLRYVEQAERLGLAHAIAQAEPRVEGQFVVLNGDNVLRADLSGVLARARDPAVDGVLVVEEVSEGEAHETGVVETAEGSEGSREVRGVVEKPDDPPSRLVQTGLFVLPAATFDACRAIEPSARGEYELADAVGWLLDRGRRFEAVGLDGWRVNVNRPADVDRAERRLRGE